jgi:RHS repeat-associated protein
MNRGMLAIAVMLFLCWTAPLLAETPAGAATYRVTIVLYPGDDPAAVAKRLAAMYRGTLETPVDGNGSFTISLSDAGAGLMRRDPMVAEMDSPSLALPAATTTGSATAALPVSQRPVETNATTSWSLGAYQYDGSGNIRKIGSEFYVYDQLGRIVVSADAQPSVVHKQTYTYDPYGNLRSINTAGRGATTLVMSGVSNRLASVSSGSVSSPVGYDGAGNFVSYLGATYEYDALNMMRKSVAGGVTRSYVYTASDERIGTIEQTGSTVRSDWTIRDSSGQVLRRYSKESNGEWKWQEDYIYRGTQMLAAEIPDSPKTRHFHLDHLGTPRLITGNGGAEVSRHTYHPFGEEIAPSPTAREKKQFAGHERDSETLDYMHARFYAPFMGRFLSVDPIINQKRSLTNPQAWNRYAYVENNPLNRTDPDGKCSKPTTGRDEVGICIEGFIASKRVGLMGVGHGDNRTFAANDATKTNRVQVQIVVNTKNGKIAAMTRAAESTAGVGPVVLRGQGTASTTLSGATRQADGTISFTSQTTAVNGLAGKPGAPKDSIDFKFNISVAPDGTVGLLPGGRTDGYPSIGAYGYTSRGTTTLYERSEGNIDDLAAPMEVAIPPR